MNEGKHYELVQTYKSERALDESEEGEKELVVCCCWIMNIRLFVISF